MQIVVDGNIPDAGRAFSRFGDIRTLDGRTLRREDLLDARALVVRSVTRVDRALLRGTPVEFVGTATIGTDHLDIQALEELGIRWASAPGSNARSVMEYVVAALLELRSAGLTGIAGERLGVVGVGAVGSLVVEAGRALGMEVIPYDPPRERRDPGFTSAPIQSLFSAAIITLHVPLTHTGPDATAGMVDVRFLSRLSSGTILINTARGDVAPCDPLLDSLRRGHLRTAVLDVWQGEPAVPVELIERCAIATPHIAGYAHDAKVRATWMLAEEMGRLFGGGVDDLPTAAGAGEIVAHRCPDPLDAVTGVVRAAYDLRRDDADLRSLLPLADDDRRRGFDMLRRNHPLRREFPAWRVHSDEEATRSILSALGFTPAQEPRELPR